MTVTWTTQGASLRQRCGRLLRRSRSLTTLVALALVVVTLPMLGAVIASIWQAERQHAETRALVDRAVRLTALGEAVDDQVGLLARTAKRFTENGKPAEQARYEARQDRLLSALDDVTAQQPAAKPRRIVRQLKNLASAPLPDGSVPADGAQAAQEQTFIEMRELADSMQTANRRALSDRLGQLARQNRSNRRGLIVGSLMMLSMAVVLMVLMARLIGRPLQQLVGGIRRLGRSELSQPIAVSGSAELRALGQELDWLRERLRAVEEDKHMFLRQVAHDLKTPLTNIKEGGALLYDGVASPARSNDIVQIIHRNATRLESLLLRLFEFTQSRDSLPAPRFESCDLAAIICRSLLEQELQLKAAQLTVDRDLAPGLVLRGDPERLATLLDNLLSNAIKFAPAGSTLSLRAWPQRAQLIVVLGDDGPGFSAEERVRAFDPFFRGARAVREDVPGTGIGLSVAQQCARLHGGGIEILGGRDGARLRVTLLKQPKEVCHDSPRLSAAGR